MITVFDFRLNNALIRYGVILMIALINAHIRSVDFNNYSFPIQSFSNLLIFGGIICSGCWVITLFLKNKLFSGTTLGTKNITRFLLSNLVVAISIYVFLYLFFWGWPVNRVNFSAYLVLTIAVVVIENLAFLLWSYLKLEKEKIKELLVPTGNRRVVVNPMDISFCEIKDGLVKIHLIDDRTISTQFQTLEELAQLLQKGEFFRANRCTIINRSAIKELKYQPNRTLSISTNGDNHISVSRYRKKEILEWLQN